jgi:hypothetical protein
MNGSGHSMVGAEPSRAVEQVLRRLGYARVAPGPRDAGVEPAFWVQEPGVPRRRFPVFIEGVAPDPSSDALGRWFGAGTGTDRRAIVVVPNDGAAEEAWRRIGSTQSKAIEGEVAILVVPPSGRADASPHWHARIAPRAEILRLATGIVVGMFRRAQASGGGMQVDFEEMLAILRQRYGIDVPRSLGVSSDEDALFVIYQMAMRFAYAPGDPGANLHMLVLKPSGPAARLPWFAA